MDLITEDKEHYSPKEQQLIVADAEKGATSLIRGFYAITLIAGVCAFGFFIVLAISEISEPYSLNMHNSISHVIINEKAAMLEMVSAVAIALSMLILFVDIKLLWFATFSLTSFVTLIWLRIVVYTAGYFLKVDFLSVVVVLYFILVNYVNYIVKDTLLDIQILRASLKYHNEE